MTRSMLEVVSDSPRYTSFFSNLPASMGRLNKTKTLLVPTNQALESLEDQEMDDERINLHFLTDLILESEIKDFNSSKVTPYKTHYMTELNCSSCSHSESLHQLEVQPGSGVRTVSSM